MYLLSLRATWGKLVKMTPGTLIFGSWLPFHLEKGKQCSMLWGAGQSRSRSELEALVFLAYCLLKAGEVTHKFGASSMPSKVWTSVKTFLPWLRLGAMLILLILFPHPTLINGAVSLKGALSLTRKWLKYLMRHWPLNTRYKSVRAPRNKLPHIFGLSLNRR